MVAESSDIANVPNLLPSDAEIVSWHIKVAVYCPLANRPFRLQETEVGHLDTSGRIDITQSAIGLTVLTAGGFVRGYHRRQRRQ